MVKVPQNLAQSVIENPTAQSFHLSEPNNIQTEPSDATLHNRKYSFQSPDTFQQNRIRQQYAPLNNTLNINTPKPPQAKSAMNHRRLRLLPNQGQAPTVISKNSVQLLSPDKVARHRQNQTMIEQFAS